MCPSTDEWMKEMWYKHIYSKLLHPSQHPWGLRACLGPCSPQNRILHIVSTQQILCDLVIWMDGWMHTWRERVRLSPAESHNLILITSQEFTPYLFWVWKPPGKMICLESILYFIQGGSNYSTKEVFNQFSFPSSPLEGVFPKIFKENGHLCVCVCTCAHTCMCVNGLIGSHLLISTHFEVTNRLYFSIFSANLSTSVLM